MIIYKVTKLFYKQFIEIINLLIKSELNIGVNKIIHKDYAEIAFIG